MTPRTWPRVTLATLTLIVLGAHLFRAGLPPLSFAVALSPLVLLARRTWAARLIQILLLLGAAEWVRTMVSLARQRLGMGLPWVRMVLILGGVTLVTLLAAHLLEPLATRKR